MKLQPPRGYITATEVKRILNISDAMVRYHVQKGRIKYLVPEGRKQGFYLKKDVDRIQNSLVAFLALDEEDEVRFELAAKEDLAEIRRIALEIFFPKKNVPVDVPEWQLAAFDKNPYTNYILRNDEHVLAYVATVPFTAGNEKIYRCLEVDTLAEIGITHDDIETFDTGKHIDLYVMAVATNPALTIVDRRKYGYRLITRFISQLVDLGAKGVIIENIIARGDTRSGVKLLQAFGFAEIVSRKVGTRAFSMNIEQSGAPVAMQYKHALRESGVLDSEPTNKNTRSHTRERAKPEQPTEQTTLGQSSLFE
jgi:hypothetical protein